MQVATKKSIRKSSNTSLRLSKNRIRSRTNPLEDDASSAGTREILESDHETFYKNEEPKTSKMNTPSRRIEVVDPKIKILEEENKKAKA